MGNIVWPSRFSAGGGSISSTLTIASGKVASDLTDYPVYVKLADMPSGFWSAVTSDGGNIRVKQSGSDVPFDVVKIDTSGHTGTLFFKASSLLAASNNVFTVETGAGLTMPAVGASNGRNAVWSAFDWVWMAEAAGSYIDRTGGADGTLSSSAFLDGPIDLAAGCGLQAQGAGRAVFTGRTARSVFTLGATGRIDSADVTGNHTLVSYALDSTTRLGILLRSSVSDYWTVWDNSNLFITTAGPSISTTNGASGRFHTVYNGSTNRKFYANGAIHTTSGAITAKSTCTGYYAGNNPGGTEGLASASLAGYLGYLYARPEALSADYIAAEYSNLNAPSSFYAIS